MDLQDGTNSLQAKLEFVEKELELARAQAERLEEQYVSANKTFEEGLKERPLDPSGPCAQAPGACSQDVTPENRHLGAQIRNRLHRGTSCWLRDNVTDCQSFIQSLYRSIGESPEPDKHSFDPSPQEQNLLAKRKTWSRCWRNDFGVRTSSAETQKTVSDLHSTLEMLESVLTMERVETEKYKQLYLSLMHECEKVSNRIKQRKSSCTCGPNVPPDLHTSECEIRFTRDDEGLLEVLDECVAEIVDNVAEVENEADGEVEVFTWEVRQEAATNQWDCMWICPPGNRCDEDPDNDLRSKLKSLEAELKYERGRAAVFEQLHLIVGGKVENWTKVETQSVETENKGVESESQLRETEKQSKEETAVGQERGQRDKVIIKGSNKPLLGESDTVSMDEDKPADTKFTVTVTGKKQVDISKVETEERTSESPADRPPWQETRSPSGWWISVRGVGLGVAAAVGVLIAVLLYF
ncbi:hypothetical protein Q5P01_020985 [Channa striata]|uniref:Uncharacterized protein n=1 Tax=Channa striata TaxID=64152 RepID=A0AA88LYQ7_CHASR|nr:hypothetical protein Q5P01_020985 [Channa striata]